MKGFDRQLRFGIRKLSIGVVSLSIASFFVVGGNSLVYATDPATHTTTPAKPAEEQPAGTNSDKPAEEQPTEHGKPLDEEIEEKERKEEEERRQHKGEFFEKDNPSLEKNTNTEDADANRVYKEPKEGTSAKGLYKVLDSLPDDFQNNELNYLKNMDAIGDKMGLKSGEIRELGLTLEKINKLGLTPEKLEQLGVEPSLIKKLNLTPERIKEIAIRPELIKEYILNEKENIALSLIFEKVEKESFTSEKLKELGLKDELTNKLNLTPERIKELLANPELIKELKLTSEENKELNAVLEKLDKETLTPEILKKMGMKEELIQKLNLTPEKIKELVLNPQLVKQLILEEEENKKINNKLTEAFEKLEKENLTVDKLKSLGLTQELADKLNLNPDKIKEYLLNPVLIEKENLTKDELEVVHNAFDRLEKESLLPEVLKKYNEFGGWKPIGGGTFAIGKKNESGHFTGWRVTGYTPEGKPIIEQGGMLGSDVADNIYLHEQALDRRFDYMLMLVKGRTRANRNETVVDNSTYDPRAWNARAGANYSRLSFLEKDKFKKYSPGVVGYNGIEKKFKAFSTKYGSSVRVDFVTGYISDILGSKGFYRVVIKAQNSKGEETTVYDETISRVAEIVQNEELYKKGLDVEAAHANILTFLKDEFKYRINKIVNPKVRANSLLGLGRIKEKDYTPEQRKVYDQIVEEATEEVKKQGDIVMNVTEDFLSIAKSEKRDSEWKKTFTSTAQTTTKLANNLNTLLRNADKDTPNTPTWLVGGSPKAKADDRAYRLLTTLIPGAKKITYHVNDDQLEVETDKYTYTAARNGSKEVGIQGSDIAATLSADVYNSNRQTFERENTNTKVNALNNGWARSDSEELQRFTYLIGVDKGIVRTNVISDKDLSDKIRAAVGPGYSKLGKGGYFSSADIHLGKDIVSYTVQIIPSDNQRVGVNTQSPRIQYNMPVLANFSIVQDTLKAAQALSHRVLNQTIKEEKEKVDEKLAEKETLISELEKNIPSLEDKLKPLESKQKELEDKQNELGDKIKPFEDKQKEIGEKLKPIEDKQKELEEKQKSVADKLKEKEKLSQEELKKLEDEAKKLEDEAKKLEDEAKPFKDEVKKLEDEAKPFKDEAKKLEDDAKKLKEEAQSLKNEIESTKSKIQLEKEKIQDIDESFKEVEKGLNKIHNQIDASKKTHQLKLLFKGNITVKYQDNNGKELKDSATLAQSGNFIRVNEEGNLSETDKNDQLVKTHKVFENGNVLEIVDNKIVKAYKVDHDGKTIKTYVVDENGDIFASDEKGEKIQELKLYKLVQKDRVEKVLNPETNKEEEKTIHEEYLARLDKDGKEAGKYNKKHLIEGKDKPEDLLEISNKIGFYYDSTSEYLRTIKKDGITYRLSKAHRGGVTATSHRPSGVLSSVNTTVTYLYDEVARAKVQVRERDGNNLIPVDNQDDFILESLVGKEFPAEAVNEKIAELKKKWYSVSSDFGNGKTRVADNVSDVDDNISQIYTIIVEKPKVRFVTEWIDVNGKQLKSSEEGEQEAGLIPNYVFLETIKTRHKITHVFMADEPIVNPIIEITIWRDTEGKELKPYEVGKKAALEFNGYRFVKTTTDDGITIHLYEKIQKPIIPGEIPTPSTPEIPNPQPNPVEPQPEPEKPCKPELPNTGTETNAGVTVLGVLVTLSGFGLLTRKKEEHEN